MSDTRYFLAEDIAIIEAIKKNNDDREASKNKAALFAADNKLGMPIFMRHGIFDMFLSGFESKGSEIDCALMTKPKDGLFRPKRVKNSKLSIAFSALCKEVDISGKATEDVLGWNRLTFFPASPGCNFKPLSDLFLFMLPARVSELKGCKEITNIEYLDLFKSEEKISA